jgi:hypothetical protein
LDNVRELGADPKKPYFVYKDDVLTLDDSFRDSALYRASQTTLAKLSNRLAEYSPVLQLLYRVKNQIVGNIMQRKQADRSEISTSVWRGWAR